MSKPVNSWLILASILTMLFVSIATADDWGATATEENLFEEIPVITGLGFFEVSKNEAPGYVCVLDSKDFSDSSARSFADLFDIYVPGVQMAAQHLWPGNVYGARGVSVDNNMKTMFLLDGQSINQRRYYGVSSEMTLPFLMDIERLEVVHGAGSIIHGSGAINGFVNIIPKDGASSPGLEVQLEYGSIDKLKKAEIGYGLNLGDEHNLYLYGAILEADGYEPNRYDWNRDFLAVVKNAGVTPRIGQYPEPTYKLAAYYKNQNFKLNTFFYSIWDSTILYHPWIQGDYDMGWYNAAFGIQPRYDFEINDTDSLSLEGNIMLRDCGFNDRGQQVDFPSEMDLLLETEMLTQIKSIYRTTRFENHHLALGMSLGYREFRSQDTYFQSQSRITWGWYSGDTQWLEYSVFGDDTIKITDQFSLSMGLRLDGVEYSDTIEVDGITFDIKDTSLSNLAPRISGQYAINDTNTVRLTYQQGFRWPDAGQISTAVINNAIVNGLIAQSAVLGENQRIVDNKPEKIDSIELNYSSQLFDYRLSLDINLYYNSYDNLTTWNNTEGTVADVGFDSAGFEVITDWKITNTTSWTNSYAYSRPFNLSSRDYGFLPLTNTDRDEWAFYSPHQFKTAITSKFFDESLVLHANAQYFSAIDDDSVVNEIFTDPAVWVNASVKYWFHKNAFMKFSVENIFDNETPNTGFFASNPQLAYNGADERMFYLSVGIRI